jgi:hypothetical protein
MAMPILSGLDGLANIGLRGGVDMRPTLIRVLTDLYMQKLRHTPEEDRHYTELALRLLDGVDVPTRATVATRLARHLSPPLRVIQYLVNDLPEVAAPLRNHPLLQPSVQPIATAEPVSIVTPIEDMAPIEPVRDAETVEPISVAVGPGGMNATTAGELNDFFFAATAYERRLILLNLHVVAPLPAEQVVIAHDPGVGQRLEAAVLGSQREDVAKELAQALHIPREQGRRIARDDYGEPVVVAVKALGIPRDVVYRILMFVNPTVGHSVERVHTLAMLFDEMSMEAAEGMVAIWQALRRDERSMAKHQPLLWNDERSRARPAAVATRRPQAAPRTNIRREVS